MSDPHPAKINQYPVSSRNVDPATHNQSTVLLVNCFLLRDL